MQQGCEATGLRREENRARDPTQMNRLLKMSLIAAAFAAVAAPLQAACYADYRANMDNPLRLHYGVIQVPDNACTVTAAAPVIAGRIASGGWTLLQVISVFDDSGLASRRADAGEYYLRY
ncbi:hypothetical protein roselon_00876 [Roseibacterium elongatum DSM 19469]|uniref:Uncharacterized protein n=1 Tax=Roseicyclus elongatus DSM 19469 TaxID=1294273 RepID=W8S3E2_9RHOB|nr:hypothetical protein roselon_00876 [Roseibacterium elongatum DSM 19469]